MSNLEVLFLCFNLFFILTSLLGIFISFKMHKIAYELFKELESKGFFK